MIDFLLKVFLVVSISLPFIFIFNNMHNDLREIKTILKENQIMRFNGTRKLPTVEY